MPKKRINSALQFTTHSLRDVPAGAVVCDDSQARDLGSETDVFWSKCPGLSVISKEDDLYKLMWSACEALL